MLFLAGNILACLVAFLATMAFVDAMLLYLGSILGWHTLSLNVGCSYGFSIKPSFVVADVYRGGRFLLYIVRGRKFNRR